METIAPLFAPLLAVLLVLLAGASQRRLFSLAVCGQSPAALALLGAAHPDPWTGVGGVVVLEGLLLLSAYSVVTNASPTREMRRYALLFTLLHAALLIVLLAPNVYLVCAGQTGALVLLSQLLLLFSSTFRQFSRPAFVGWALGLVGLVLFTLLPATEANGTHAVGQQEMAVLIHPEIYSVVALLIACGMVLQLGGVFRIFLSPLRATNGFAIVVTLVSTVVFGTFTGLLLVRKLLAGAYGEDVMGGAVFLACGSVLLFAGAFLPFALRTLSGIVSSAAGVLVGIACLGIGWGGEGATSGIMLAGGALVLFSLSAFFVEEIEGAFPQGDVRGAGRILPWTGLALFLSMLGLLALPPLPIYFLVTQLLGEVFPAHPVSVILVLFFLLTALVGSLRTLLPALFGPEAEASSGGSRSVRSIVPLLIFFLLWLVPFIPRVEKQVWDEARRLWSTEPL